ncbi:hypothetical protein V5R04_07245 [Jonesiaceae bacterium BS-20]|uniref:Uncharacterized protein n=1 Tax=Jonesiaceae bacterium BS-20 TaxID=3120821 RepID=A0AAU7E0H4_9MICO
MSKTRSKKKSTYESAWDSAIEAPRTDLPDYEKIEKRYRRTRRAVRIWWFSAPVVLFAVLAMIGQILGAEDTGSQGETLSPTRAQAIASVEQWLERTPSPLPGAHVLTWESATALQLAEGVSPAEVDTYTRESHVVTLLTATGATVKVNVLIASDGLGRAAALTEPSLQATLPVPEELSQALLWPGMAPAALATPAEQAVESWASAFGSGDPVALRQVVGDPNAANVYLPLTGLDAVDVSIGATAQVQDKAGNPTGAVIANVTLTLNWTGVAKPVNEDSLPTVAYDLLIDGADTGAPRVVAWGGAGTGPSLQAYGNAVPVSDDEAKNVTPIEDTADAELEG